MGWTLLFLPALPLRRQRV
ncbi:GlyGly-CTERM sorting domain-containing protein [Phocaeicola dorei]|nr:GlyGly-CTERM sorting domain-containing protein [Phocaeicola dorei]